MRHTLAFLVLSFLLSQPALAQQDLPRPAAQIALLPIGSDGRDDIISLVMTHWQPYFQTEHPQAFGREAIRSGRFDLDGDGQAELVLLLNKPGWEAQHGYPLVVANWSENGWNAVGWSWGDEDTVFATDEIVDGWRSVDTGTQLLRWDRGLYGRVDRN